LSDLEVLESIPRACQAFFPVTHAATTKNYLLNAQISASGNSQLHAQGINLENGVADYINQLRQNRNGNPRLKR